MSRKQSAKSKANKVKEDLDNAFAEYFALTNMIALIEPDNEDKIALTQCLNKLNKVLKRIYEKHEMLQAEDDEIMSRWIKAQR